MEEKERFEWRYSPKTMEDHMFDNLTKIKIYYENIPNLLNQYEKQIKEVEKGKQELKTYLDKAINDCNKFFEENQQLKQQLHELPKKIVEDIKEFCEDWKDYDRHYNPAIILVENSGMRTQPTLYNELNIILKKYGGENE